MRIDAAQPYVWADIRPDDATGTLLNLIIGNSGPTIAQNVQVKVDPALPVVGQLQERADTAQKRLADGIQSLPPGRTLMWPLGQGFNLIKDQGPQAYIFTITANGVALPSQSSGERGWGHIETGLQFGDWREATADGVATSGDLVTQHAG